MASAAITVVLIITEAITEIQITAAEDSEIQTMVIRITKGIRIIKAVVDLETKAAALKIEDPIPVQEGSEVQAALAADQKLPTVDLTVVVSEIVQAAPKAQVLLPAQADSKTAVAALDK